MFSSRLSRAAAVLLLTASVSFAQWEDAADSSAKRSTQESAPAASAGKGRMSEAKEQLYRDMASSGNSLYKMGSYLAWGGLAVNVAGNLSNSFVVARVGGLVNAIGIPMMGVGAGRVQSAARAINPEAGSVGNAGWPLYWGGWGLQAAGIVVLVSSTEDDGYGDPSISSGALATGIVLLLTGQVLHYVSWYQFSRRREIGNINLISLSVLPDIRVADNRVTAGGAKLVWAF
jgi:hypothetical protein